MPSALSRPLPWPPRMAPVERAHEKCGHSGPCWQAHSASAKEARSEPTAGPRLLRGCAVPALSLPNQVAACWEAGAGEEDVI